MANLVVITFDDAKEAGKVRESLRGIEKQGLLSLDDSAVIVKDGEGRVQVKNETDRGVKVGAVGGGMLGLLIGSIFFPFAGLIGGALAGAVVGRLADLGVDQKFVHEVGVALKPDSSAIFIMVREANATAAIAALKPYQGEVYHTSLPTDTEQELRDILARRVSGGRSKMEKSKVGSTTRDIRPGIEVEALDGHAGTVGELVTDAASGEVTHFALEGGKKEVTLPLSAVERVVGDTVYLKLDRQAIGRLPAIPARRGDESKIDLVAIAFDAPEDAARALGFIDQFRKKGTLKILNAAVLVADAEGTVNVKDTRDIDPKKGRLLGAVTGGLIGLAGGPVGAVVGALAGAGAGGLAGKKIDLGFSEPFLDGLKQYLKPNTSALVVLIEHGYYEQLSDVIAEEEGVFFRQTLTDKLVAELAERE